MMHAALVHWVPPEDIGREHLPPVLRMVVLSRFPEDGQNCPDGSWSVEMLFDQPPAEQKHNVSEARVQFAFENAPEQRLHAGARFSIKVQPRSLMCMFLIEERCGQAVDWDSICTAQP